MTNNHSSEHLFLLPYQLAICQLPPTSAIPDWVFECAFWSVTRTPAELSLVVSQERVPPGISSESGWRAFRFEGPLFFSQVGVLVRALGPLTEAQVSVFAISTYDTDYILVKDEQLDSAWAALVSAGYQIREA